jgi:hypothetical protein
MQIRPQSTQDRKILTKALMFYAESVKLCLSSRPGRFNPLNFSEKKYERLHGCMNNYHLDNKGYIFDKTINAWYRLCYRIAENRFQTPW